jgi:large conductance mechanosensitive channel
MADKIEKASESKKGFFKEFVDFLQTFGVIGLAIGFVIGLASGQLVSSLVKDLINPLIGLVLPGDLSTLGYSTNATLSGKQVTFAYGDFISSIINFLVIALVIFIAYKQLKKMGLAKV